MHLLAASVKNYRIHEDLSVDFAPGLTLVGGPNESGKSTLVEAIHRALFLKATITGAAQREMASTRGGGHPEVEVSFEAEGSTWRLAKTFSGGSGKAVLEESGGATLHGADAEARLAELLRVEEAGGGRGAAQRAAGQWAHLWVWQGTGGDDPSAHAEEQRDALLSRLEKEGGGAAMQSDLDARIAEHFRGLCDELFTRTNQPRAGSDLQRALDERDASREVLERAEASLSRLERAVREFRDAEALLAGREVEDARLARELGEAEAKAKEVVKLRHQVELQGRTREDAEKSLAQWRRAIDEVARLRAEVKRLEEEARPEADAVRRLEERVREAEVAASGTEKSGGEIEGRIIATRAELDLLRAHASRMSCLAELAELERRRDSIAKLQKKVDATEAELARLPELDRDSFGRLQRLDSDLSESDAVLRALSTGIEVVRSEGPVEAGDAALEPGDRIVIDRETLVTSGDSLALRISPGGGASLDDARRRAAELRREREEAFASAGIGSLEEGGEALGKREAIAGSLRELRAELTGMDAEEVERSREETSRRLAALEAEVERRSASVEETSLPGEESGVHDRIRDLESALDALEATRAEAREEQAAATAALGEARTQLTAARESHAEIESGLVALRARLRASEEPLGSEDERGGEEESRKRALESAQENFSRLEAELEQLQPDTIEADLDRLRRALDAGRRECETARESRASARALLASDGSLDPAAAVETARARHEAAEERLGRVARRADAIRLLRDRFAEEQEKLSRQFSRPLAGKVGAYLRMVFGPKADASVTIEEGSIGGWNLTRDGRTFPFDQLSGGTREQVAAAVRLAIAELLAEDHGGCLPVVFDDAFTHSDPERVRSLQRMLDLAARSGLQVVLLTCDPEDYAGLGAETVRLGPGAA